MLLSEAGPLDPSEEWWGELGSQALGQSCGFSRYQAIRLGLGVHKREGGVIGHQAEKGLEHVLGDGSVGSEC